MEKKNETKYTNEIQIVVNSPILIVKQSKSNIKSLIFQVPLSERRGFVN